MIATLMSHAWVAFLLLAIGRSGPDCAAANQDQPALNDRGQKLMDRYAGMHAALKAEITAVLSVVSPHARSEYLRARAAEDAAAAAWKTAEEHLHDVKHAQGLVGHARNYWIPKAEKSIATAKAKLSSATTEADRIAA